MTARLLEFLFLVCLFLVCPPWPGRRRCYFEACWRRLREGPPPPAKAFSLEKWYSGTVPKG